jgi:adenylate cyclase
VLVTGATAEQLRHERLRRYFSPEVARMLADAPADDSVAESREVTLLFADLRHFTALAERLAGTDVVAILNAYFERMVRTIFTFGGTLDKFLGDGLMVYFGAPITQADHAERAIRCARAMQEELARWNQERRARGEVELEMGIGIHTGTVVLGSIGSRQRREYTALGDAVNVASRLQELSKTIEAPILVSEATRRALDDRVPLTACGPVQLRGRTEPLDVYRVAPTS